MISIFNRRFFVLITVLLQGVFVGAIIGFVVAVFRFVIEKSHESFIFLANFTELTPKPIYLIVLCIFGLIAGYITQRFAPDAEGSGIPQVKLAIQKPEKIIKLKTTITKFFGAIFSIASGLSLGKEGPCIQIGAGIAGKISKVFYPWGRRAMVYGGAAGLAAAFNTPVAATLFILEELEQGFSHLNLGAAFVSTLSAALVSDYVYKNTFRFEYDLIPDLSLKSLVAYVALGVLCGFLSILFKKMIIGSLKFHKTNLSKIPLWIHGAIAGLLTGVVALFIPEVLFGNHLILNYICEGQYIWWMVILLFLFKLLLTSIAYGSRVPGGIFAPALVLGALLGLSFAHFANFLLPGLEISTLICTLIGMGAFFSGVSRTPITALVLIVEMTRNYNLLVPLLCSCLAANLSTETLRSVSIYEAFINKGMIKR